MTNNKIDQELADVTSLYEITKVLASSTDLRECLEQIMEILSSSRGMSNGTVSIINPSNSQLEIEVAHGLTAEARKRGKYEVGEGITGRVVATGAPIVVPSISDEPLFLNRTRARGDISQKQISFFCVPISHGPQVIGALSVDREYTSTLKMICNF